MSVEIGDEIPRHEPENPYNYTPLQLATRKKALRDLQKDYPSLTYAWLEMVYDWHENTPKEEIERIINNKVFEGKGRFSDIRNIELPEESKSENVIKK